MSFSTLLRSAVGRRLCGVKPEVSSRVLRDFERLSLGFGVGGGLDYAVPSYAPLDQLSTGSCLAQAYCLGEVVTLKARHGIDSPLPSRLAAYYWARWVEGEGIADVGTRASALLEAVEKYGLPPESSCPFSVWRVNSRPPMGARWDAQNRVGRRKSYQVYYESLEARIKALQAGLATGRAFIIVVPVTKNFMEHRAGIVPFPNSRDVIGLHAMLGVDVASTGETMVVNSWGPAWGSNGRALLHPAFLERSPSVVVLDPEVEVR